MIDDNLYKPYNRTTTQQPPTPTVNAVGRSPDSPSGTDWNRTFTQNNPYSPSGTNWSSTFSGTIASLPTRVIGSPSGTDWSKTFGRTSSALAGNTTPPPSPGDIDNTFFGGPTPTPTPTPKPSLAFYRDRLLDGDLSSRDREMYGAGSDFGFST